MQTLSVTFTPGERDVFRRQPFIAPSVWAPRSITVTEGPYAGSRLKLSVAPYLAGIMDAYGDPDVESVAVCGSPQIGKTVVLYALIAYSIERRPGPKMLGMPNDDALNRAVQHKLLPTLRKSTVARHLSKETRDILHLRDGSPIYLSSAQSPSDLATVSVRDMFLDEEDLYKQLAGQGAPVLDFLERTTAYRYKRKIVRISKPIGDETSSIYQAAFKDADELRRYYAVCPACNTGQVMHAGQLVALDGCKDPHEIKRRHLGRYECEHCKYRWSDHVRDVAVSRGYWQADTPVERPRSIGFHLPSLVSQFVSLSEVMSEKVEAEQKNSQRDWQSFYNGRLAEPYQAKEIETDEQRVLAHVCDLPPRLVPRQAVALTCGVDMQKRGFYFSTWAWAEDMEHWLIDYGYIRGGWDELHDGLLFRTYPIEAEPDAPEMNIWRMGLDTGGGDNDTSRYTRTEEAYMFVRRYGGRRLFACKGASHAQLTPVRWSHIDKLPRSNTAIKGGLDLVILDTAYFKGLIHGRMDPESRQPVHLHSETGEDYARQICAERLERRKNGTLHWVRTHKDNHYIDCQVIAYACADQTWNPNLQALARQRKRAALPENLNQAKAGAPPQVPGGLPSWLGAVRR